MGYILVWLSLKSELCPKLSWGKGRSPYNRIHIRTLHVIKEIGMKAHGLREGSEFFLYCQKVGDYNSVRSASRKRKT